MSWRGNRPQRIDALNRWRARCDREQSWGSNNDEAEVIGKLVVSFPGGLSVEPPAHSPQGGDPAPAVPSLPVGPAPGGAVAAPGLIGTLPVAPPAPAADLPAPR